MHAMNGSEIHWMQICVNIIFSVYSYTIVCNVYRDRHDFLKPGDNSGRNISPPIACMEQLAIRCKSQQSLGYQPHASTTAIFKKITVLPLLLVLIIIIRIIIMMISMIIIIISVSHKHHQLVVFIPVLPFPCLYRRSYSQLEATLPSCCLLSLVLCWSESAEQNFVWRLVRTNAKIGGVTMLTIPVAAWRYWSEYPHFRNSDSFRDDLYPTLSRLWGYGTQDIYLSCLSCFPYLPIWYSGVSRNMAYQHTPKIAMWTKTNWWFISGLKVVPSAQTLVGYSPIYPHDISMYFHCPLQIWHNYITWPDDIWWSSY